MLNSIGQSQVSIALSVMLNILYGFIGLGASLLLLFVGFTGGLIGFAIGRRTRVKDIESAKVSIVVEKSLENVENSSKTSIPQHPFVDTTKTTIVTVAKKPAVQSSPKPLLSKSPVAKPPSHTLTAAERQRAQYRPRS